METPEELIQGDTALDGMSHKQVITLLTLHALLSNSELARQFSASKLLPYQQTQEVVKAAFLIAEEYIKRFNEKSSR
jgi:hypothetical protein